MEIQHCWKYIGLLPKDRFFFAFSDWSLLVSGSFQHVYDIDQQGEQVQHGEESAAAARVFMKKLQKNPINAISASPYFLQILHD